MMSYERSNNRGQIVGTVLGSRLANRDVRGLKPDDRRRRAAIARIELFEPVARATCWSFATTMSSTSS